VSPKLQRFVAEYLIDLNATQAAIRAGYSARTAEQQGHRLLRNAEVTAAVAAARDERAKRTEITADRVLAEAWALLTADPRELVELHVDCCRHCYGKDHRYQFTRAELARASGAHEAGRTIGAEAAFDEQGGPGFDPRKPPADDCPECHGRGVARVLVNDTRQVSPAAAALYAGAKQTREGIEIKLHPKVDAIEKLCKHLGLYDRIKPGAESMAKLLDSPSVADQGRALFVAVAQGDLTVGQAAQLITGLGTLARLIETTELERRIKALELETRREA
jgi:phage terminase small subunit